MACCSNIFTNSNQEEKLPLSKKNIPRPSHLFHVHILLTLLVAPFSLLTSCSLFIFFQQPHSAVRMVPTPGNVTRWMNGYQTLIKKGSFAPVVHAMMITGAIGMAIEHKAHVAKHPPGAHGDGHH